MIDFLIALPPALRLVVEILAIVLGQVGFICAITFAKGSLKLAKGTNARGFAILSAAMIGMFALIALMVCLSELMAGAIMIKASLFVLAVGWITAVMQLVMFLCTAALKWADDKLQSRLRRP